MLFTKQHYSNLNPHDSYRSSHQEVFLGKGIQQIYRRTPMSKCDFNKVTKRHGCSPVNLLHIFRALFPRNTFGSLLLFSVPRKLWKGGGDHMKTCWFWKIQDIVTGKSDSAIEDLPFALFVIEDLPFALLFKLTMEGMEN